MPSFAGDKTVIGATFETPRVPTGAYGGDPHYIKVHVLAQCSAAHIPRRNIGLSYKAFPSP